MPELIFGGDAMLGRGVNRVIQHKGPEYPLEGIAPICNAADLFLLNLECAISPNEGNFSGAPKAFYFKADPSAADTLALAGVNMVSLANNHALDADAQGLRDTLRILSDHGIRWVGAGEDDAAASQSVVVELGGVKIGALGYCDHQEDFAAGEARPGIRFVDLSQPASVDRIMKEVAELSKRCHHVVVAFHWMPNWVRKVPTFYRDFGQGLVHAGASIVWGHSPHHFLGVEWVESGVILYSTGGLVDDYAVDPDFRNDRSLLFRIMLGREKVEHVEGIPIELKFARTEVASGEVREWITARLGAMSLHLGSQVVRRGPWLEINPG